MFFDVAVHEGGVSISVMSQVAALIRKLMYDMMHSRCDNDTFWKVSHYIGLASK